MLNVLRRRKQHRGLESEFARGVVMRVVEEPEWFVLVFEHDGGRTDFEVVFPNLRYFQVTPEDFYQWCVSDDGRGFVSRVYEAVGEYVRYRDVKESESVVSSADAVETGAMLSVADVQNRLKRVREAKDALVSAIVGSEVGTVFTL